MPELPEVETIRREILPFVKGRVFARLQAIDRRSIKGQTPQQTEKELKGKKVRGVERRAKYLIFPLHPAGFLVVHLGMTGRLLFAPDKYVKVIFHFKDGKKLYFSDARLFGKIRYFAEEPKLEVGPDVLSDEFSLEKFKQAVGKRKSAIKLLLMDQKIFSGVGNIYANEALFGAGILPSRPANGLKEEEIRELYKAIQAVMKEAIKYRGTSDSWYLDAKGQKGEFQNHLKVYGRADEPCVKCSTPIRRTAQGQRGTYFCPKCQK